MKLLLTNKHTLETVRCDEHHAAKLMDIEVEQLCWALDEYRRCDAAPANSQYEYVAIEEEYEA